MIQVVLVLLVIGVLLWFIATYIPIDPMVLRLLQGFVILCCLLWLLSLFGLLPIDLPVPRLTR